MDSAFGNWQPAASSVSPDSAFSAGSVASSEDGGRKLRVVGFPEEPAGPILILHKETSCCLDERPKRQSSLAQQLQLQAFEERPKPPRINVKSRNRMLRVTMSQQSTPSEGLPAPDESLLGRTVPSDQSALMRRALAANNSDAVEIPQGLTKAYTAPEPLPELSPELLQLFAVGNNAAEAQVRTPDKLAVPRAQQRVKSPRSSSLRPVSPSSVAGGSSHPNYSSTSASQVAALREALRKEQDEVARLRREMAKMTTAAAQQLQQRNGGPARGGSGRPESQFFTPVTPDAEANQAAASSSNQTPRSISSSHFHGITSEWVP